MYHLIPIAYKPAISHDPMCISVDPNWALDPEVGDHYTFGKVPPPNTFLQTTFCPTYHRYTDNSTEAIL